jgi:hypothetical protein
MRRTVDAPDVPLVAPDVPAPAPVEPAPVEPAPVELPAVLPAPVPVPLPVRLPEDPELAPLNDTSVRMNPEPEELEDEPVRD